MMSSGVVIGIPGILPDEEGPIFTITGTPADIFPDEQRAQFCGTGNAKSNDYITEYKIPTECTQPLAIVADPQGNVWFAQSNTGKVAKFIPSTESFTEFANPEWESLEKRTGSQLRSMMWGMDYSPDGSIWYTDEALDSIWRFSIQDETYDAFSFPSDGDALPQKLQVFGSQIIVNDFTGNKIAFIDAVQAEGDIPFDSIPAPFENGFTGDFDIDSDDSIWYTNWTFQQNGILVNFDLKNYRESIPNVSETSFLLSDFIEYFEFPPGMTTPNGLSLDKNGKVWIADTSSSFFFKFDPDDETFTRYLTSEPPASTYGNSTGVIKTPVTRPYWMEQDESGRIVFNEQTANRLGFFDPADESLVEYLIPSKNPHWGDCEFLDDCGLAQVFGFDVDGDKVWFTEWVENNIGVLDTSVPLPLEIEIAPQEITLKKGESIELPLEIIPLKGANSENVSIVISTTATFSDLIIESEIDNLYLNNDEIQTISITITANEKSLARTHKVLVGVQTADVTISKYVTIKIES